MCHIYKLHGFKKQKTTKTNCLAVTDFDGELPDRMSFTVLKRTHDRKLKNIYMTSRDALLQAASVYVVCL
jgi:hypothetical protein